MRLLLPTWVRLSWTLEQNLIVRAHKPACGVIAQLDDLKGGHQIDHVRGMAFLTVETSPDNFQVWLAIEGGDDALVKRLMNGIGSDPRANCSGRLAGSPNVKPKYAPDFPMVRIAALQPGRRVTPAELASLGLIAPPVVARPAVSSHLLRSAGPSRGWPDYDRCLRGAPPRSDGQPDRSRADYLWCKWAIERSHSPEAVLVQLLETSEKARHEWQHGNRDYVRRTVLAAAEVARRP